MPVFAVIKPLICLHFSSAVDNKTGNNVAIKQMKLDIEAQQLGAYREVSFFKRLKHANVAYHVTFKYILHYVSTSTIT